MIMYEKEYKYWTEKYNPNNFKNTWSMLESDTLKYWYYSMFWSLGWTGFALINYIIGLAGLINVFNVLNLVSILGPVGTVALTIIADLNYKHADPVFGANAGDWYAIFGNIVGST